MKFNLEIEIDWIDEDNTIDEFVKKEIINGVTSQINQKIYSDIETKVNNKIDKTVISKVNKLTDKMFKDFTKRKIVITDRYGDEQESYHSMNDLIKTRFDSFMNQKVDDKGKVCHSSYSNKKSRVQFLIDDQLKGMADKFTKDTVAKVEQEMKAYIENTLKDQIGNKMMEVLEIKNLLNSGK